MHLGYFFVAILVGWAYASLTEKPSTGAKVFGPWDMSELIRHGLIVGGAILGIVLLVIFTNANEFTSFEDGETETKTVFTLAEVSGVAIGAIIGAVLAGDIWRVVQGFMGGGKSGGSTGTGV